MEGREWENRLIEDDVSRNIDAPFLWVKALLPFMKMTIADKNTLSRAKFKFP
jgi:hypothetical protein